MAAPIFATPMYLHLMVFVILILATALFLGGTAAVLAYRNRLLAAASRSSTSTPVSSRADLEKCDTTLCGAPCNDSIEPRAGLIERFLRWRRRVLYESDSLPELALLPSYRPKESVWRKTLNLLLRKKRVIPDPPTIVTITRVIEAAEARERAAAAAAAAITTTGAVVAKADVPALPLPPLPLPPAVRAHTHMPNARARPPAPRTSSFQIPAIVVQCWDTPTLPATPVFPPSRSSTSISSPGCLMPPSLSSSSSSSSSSSGLGLALSPAVASPATFFFPSFPSASLSPFDYLHVPPPFWGGPMATATVVAEQAQALADAVSHVSGARFVLGPAPPPRAVLKSQSRSIGAGMGMMYAPPPACMAFAGSAPVKRVDGERKVKCARDVRSSANGGPVPRAPQEGVVGIVAAGRGLSLDSPRAASGGSDSSDSDDCRDPKRQDASDSDVPSPVLGPEEGLLASSSTTSSLVDLILEAIAAETDESFHYTTVSTSFSATSSSSSTSSSRSSTASTVSSHSGASWASDKDEEAVIAASKADQDGHRSFLMLEDESEEDFMDAVLSAYIRTDDEDSNSDSEVYSSTPGSSGSDYGEFDDVDLCDPGSLKTAVSDMKGSSLLPPRRKFLSVVRVVHPGFAI